LQSKLIKDALHLLRRFARESTPVIRTTKKSNLRVCSFLFFVRMTDEAEPTSEAKLKYKTFAMQGGEDKFAAALRLVLRACTQNGKLFEGATTCSHFGALLVNLPSIPIFYFHMVQIIKTA